MALLRQHRRIGTASSLVAQPRLGAIVLILTRLVLNDSTTGTSKYLFPISSISPINNSTLVSSRNWNTTSTLSTNLATCINTDCRSITTTVDTVGHSSNETSMPSVTRSLSSDSENHSSSDGSPSSEIGSSSSGSGSLSFGLGSRASNSGGLAGSGSFVTSTNTITSTRTSVPPDFTGITLPGTTFTTNEWITTTDYDHHTTLIPFILIGGGRGVELWNLPPIPNVDFSFPNLPEFHLPCIRLFGVSLGDCTSPPVNDAPPPDALQSNAPSNPGTASSAGTSTQPTSASPSTSSSMVSSTCTTTGIESACSVSCANMVSDGASCASYSTTCTTVTAACRAPQGTTTTISSTETCIASPPASFPSATATICGANCLLSIVRATGLVVPPFTTSAPDTTPEYRRRAIPGRIQPGPLEKRNSAPSVSIFGHCALATPASSPLQIPEWPAVGSDMISPEIAGRLPMPYSSISRYDRATIDGCVFTTTRLSANDFQRAPLWQDYRGGNYGNNNNVASLDHAYEIHWLKQFFDQIVSSQTVPNPLRCSQVNQYFFPTKISSTGAVCSYNVLRDVFGALSGHNNLRFIAMSQYLNGNAKANFFPNAGDQFEQRYVNDPQWVVPRHCAGWIWRSNGNPGPPWAVVDSFEEVIWYFEVVFYGVLEMKTDNMFDLIDQTNSAIYSELQTLDLLIFNNPGNMFGNLEAYRAAFPNGLAEAYKTFMTSLIEPQINTPPQYLTRLWTTIIDPLIRESYYVPGVGMDPYDDQPGPYYNEWAAIYNLLVNHNNHYWSDNPNAYTWDYTFAFSWDTTNTRRDLESFKQDTQPSENDSKGTRKDIRNNKKHLKSTEEDVWSILRGQGSCQLPGNSTALPASIASTSQGTMLTDITSRKSPTAFSTFSKTSSMPLTTFWSNPAATNTGPSKKSQSSEAVSTSTNTRSRLSLTSSANGTSYAPSSASARSVTSKASATLAPTSTTAVVRSSTDSSSRQRGVSSAMLTGTSVSLSGAASGFCHGNQIEGTCTGALLPTATPDAGREQPVCAKVGTGDSLRFSAVQAAVMVETYCEELFFGNIVLSAHSPVPKVGTQPVGAEKGGQIAVDVLFDVDSCEPGTPPGDQKFDFAAHGPDVCFQNLYTVIATSCAQDSTWADFNPDYTLEGGAWGRSCVLWSMEGIPAAESG